MTTATESLVMINGGPLYVRKLGTGPALVVLHGGPEFDSAYLVPELDVLAECCQLVYYDQRGRGRSPAVPPEGVTIESEVADLDALRRHLEADQIAVLGHSWGGVLAVEYATRHPESVAGLILLNSAPVSAHEWDEFLAAWRGSRSREDSDLLAALVQDPSYLAGDLAADAAAYRIIFRNACQDPALVDELVARLRAHVNPAGVLASRVIEDRLYADTVESAGYDAVPGLAQRGVRTLVVHGELDFVPVAMLVRVARSIPGARLEVLAGCGHFSYAERPHAVKDVICRFLRGPSLDEREQLVGVEP